MFSKKLKRPRIGSNKVKIKKGYAEDPKIKVSVNIKKPTLTFSS